MNDDLVQQLTDLIDKATEGIWIEHYTPKDIARAVMDSGLVRAAVDWEWGVRRPLVGEWMVARSEQEARDFAVDEFGERVFRRRPAGPWEEVDDV